MRFVLALLILSLAACAPLDQVPSGDPDADENSVEREEGLVNETMVEDGAETNRSDVPAANGSGTVRVPDPANESANLSDEWFLGEDESGDPIVVEPRARLNESYIGIVPSSDPTPRIVSFSLIAVSTNRVIPEFSNMTGTVRIDRERVPRSIAVRANYAGEVGSVLFSLDDAVNHRVENKPPFALHGVDEFGRFEAWTPPRGRYEITATPFERSDGIGPSSEPASVLIEFYAPGYLDRVQNP